MSSSRILSQLHKSNWNGYFRRGINQKATNYSNPILRYYEFLQSEQGKKALFVGATIFSFGVFVVKLLPQASLSQKYIQMFYQSYYSPEKVTPVTQAFGQSIINNVVQDMGLLQRQAESLKFFVGNFAEPAVFGSFAFGSVLVGYPPFFNIFSHEELPDMLKVKFGMKVGDDVPEISNIRSREGKAFRDTLYLSDDAKKFALAREMNWALDTPVFVPPAISGLAVHINYGVCRYFNFLLPFLSKSLGQRYGIYFTVSFFFYVLHKKAQDFFYNNRICKADEKAALLGSCYREGGVEYYDKLLRRNVSLRELIPHARGRRLYNLKGNPVSPLFGSRLTISQRKRLIDELEV
ncbi:transmembrane protein 177 isoform X2 [Lepeophtheirus salmonis]|uniref:transmembrane protein 177 isoform X2 n=1 Tax=Lepeophtheirus salmonis TaxID=72036 RepID=UPI001AEA6F6E|nr:uncharacterized protein LOC121128467 isoform X2 [Lepeophtheirus salmonis]